MCEEGELKNKKKAVDNDPRINLFALRSQKDLLLDLELENLSDQCKYMANLFSNWPSYMPFSLPVQRGTTLYYERDHNILAMGQDVFLTSHESMA